MRPRWHGRAGGPGRGHHRRRQRHRPGHRPTVRRGGRHASSSATSTPTPGKARRRRGRRPVRAGRRRPSGAGRALFADGGRDVRLGGHRVQQRRDLAAGRRLDPRPPASTPGDRVQEVNLTSVYLCCKAAIPHMQAQGKRLDHQHRVVRRRAWARRPRRSPTPRPRAACSRCRASWACSSPARASGSTRCAPGR